MVDLNLMNTLMVVNFARYVNQEMGTNIIVTPDGQIVKELSDFLTKDGTELTDTQFKQLAVQYGNGMSKFFDVCADIIVDSATAGIVNEMSGSDPNITLVIS